MGIYRVMLSKVIKDGKPYILSVKCDPPTTTYGTQGYTVAATSVFNSVRDMKYYDNSCEAHATLRNVAKALHQGAMMVYFENKVERLDHVLLAVASLSD